MRVEKQSTIHREAAGAELRVDVAGGKSTRPGSAQDRAANADDMNWSGMIRQVAAYCAKMWVALARFAAQLFHNRRYRVIDGWPEGDRQARLSAYRPPTDSSDGSIVVERLDICGGVVAVRGSRVADGPAETNAVVGCVARGCGRASSPSSARHVEDPLSRYDLKRAARARPSEALRSTGSLRRR
jgi:hypothetical protein